jgi:hypothetical protein
MNRPTVLSIWLNMAFTFLGAQGQSASLVPKPEWIDTLPESSGRIYALGTADLGSSEGQSLSRAGDRAKLEVVARLRTTVKGRTLMTSKAIQYQSTDSKATGYGEKRFSDEVAVSAQAEDLPGLALERTYLDQKGRTAYALAYLDMAQAQRSVQEKLETLREIRKKSEREKSRKSRWRLRKAQADLTALDGQASMLAPAGLAPELRPSILAESELVDKRLAMLEAMDLPPLDMSKMTASVRTNIDLPPNLSDWLDQQIVVVGLKRRGAGADFVLDVVFQGGSKGPELLFAEPQFWGSITYRIEANATIKDSQGVALGKVAPISLAKEGSAAGLIEEFQRIFRRRLNSLMDQLRGELE